MMYLVSVTISIEAENTEALVAQLGRAVQQPGFREAIGAARTSYFTVSVNEQEPDPERSREETYT
jgi:hypothetical protein